MYVSPRILAVTRPAPIRTHPAVMRHWGWYWLLVGACNAGLVLM